MAAESGLLFGNSVNPKANREGQPGLVERAHYRQRKAKT
jgi:hypothetical protein